MDLDWSEGQSANQQRFLRSAIYTVGEPGLLLDANRYVHLDTHDGIAVDEEKGF